MQIPAINFRSGQDFFIHDLLGYSWWAVWATFVMLLISIAATLAGKLQEASRLLGLLATASFTMNTWVTDSTSLFSAALLSMLAPQSTVSSLPVTWQ